MAKTRTPFLSLGSQGSVGDVLTSQKRYASTLMRRKPKPADPYSLPQAYQRWLYEDYAYLWTKQNAAMQREYASLGSRFHLTGFQYWMKANLTTLPDIMGMWRLDESAGAVAADSSKHANHGTIYGAAPAEGRIAGAFSFDGSNDYVRVTTPTSVQKLTRKSVLFFVKPTAFTGSNRLLYDHSYTTSPYGDMIYAFSGTNNLYCYLKNSAGVAILHGFSYAPDEWLHIAYSWDGTNVQFYKQGVPDGAPVAFSGTLACTALPLDFGGRGATLNFECLIDHVLILNRPLDDTEVLRHSKRRYVLPAAPPPPPPVEIDIGSPAIGRPSYMPSPYTFFTLENPANASGPLDTIEFVCGPGTTGLRVGTFYLISGTTYKCRDSATLGDFPSGYNKVSGLSIDAVIGDFIGLYMDAGNVARSLEGYSGIRLALGEHIDPGDEANFSFFYSGDTISLEGEGIAA